MAKFPMDLSKFQKISSTDRKTTLKHKDGHFMVIAHGKIDPELRKGLEALPFAKGGRISDREIKKQRQERDDNPGEPHGTLENYSPEGKKTPIGIMQREEALKNLRSKKKPELYAQGGGVDDVPEPDPKKAKEMEAGATQSGWQPEQWGKNLKEGLGLSAGGKVNSPKGPFHVVVREHDYKPFERRPGRDAWGWEPADSIEIPNYEEAKKRLADYAAAMPKHTVRLRIGKIIKNSSLL